MLLARLSAPVKPVSRGFWNHGAVVMLRAGAVVVLLLLTACGDGGPHVVLPENVPLSVHLLGTTARPQEFIIQPSDQKYRKFKAWMERNADGWYPFYATPPSSGILVNAHQFSLQFTGSRALVTTEAGVFEKSVEVADYAYLSTP